MKKVVLYKDEDGKKVLIDRFNTKKEANVEVRDILESDEDADVFSYSTEEEEYDEITDRVKTYADACKVLGIAPMNEDNMKAQGFRPDEIARRKLETIAEALNEGWKPDWNNTNEYKYYPWFYIEPSTAGAYAGLAYAAATGAASSATTNFGSRLCFRESRLARYAGNTFTELYQQILVEKL